MTPLANTAFRRSGRWVAAFSVIWIILGAAAGVAVCILEAPVLFDEYTLQE